MAANQILQLISLVLWLVALVSFYFSIRVYPKSHQKERFWYATIMMSYILHVLIFFSVVLYINQPPSIEITFWSMGVYIHGALALTIKEILATIRVRMHNNE